MRGFCTLSRELNRIPTETLFVANKVNDSQLQHKEQDIEFCRTLSCVMLELVNDFLFVYFESFASNDTNYIRVIVPV